MMPLSAGFIRIEGLSGKNAATRQLRRDLLPAMNRDPVCDDFRPVYWKGLSPDARFVKARLMDGPFQSNPFQSNPIKSLTGKFLAGIFTFNFPKT